MTKHWLNSKDIFIRKTKKQFFDIPTPTSEYSWEVKVHRSLKGCTCIIILLYYRYISGTKWSWIDNNIVCRDFFGDDISSDRSRDGPMKNPSTLFLSYANVSHTNSICLLAEVVVMAMYCTHVIIYKPVPLKNATKYPHLKTKTKFDLFSIRSMSILNQPKHVQTGLKH